MLYKRLTTISLYCINITWIDINQYNITDSLFSCIACCFLVCCCCFSNFNIVWTDVTYSNTNINSNMCHLKCKIRYAFALYELGSVGLISKIFPRIISFGVCFFNGNNFKFKNNSTHIHLIIYMSFVELQTWYWYQIKACTDAFWIICKLDTHLICLIIELLL